MKIPMWTPIGTVLIVAALAVYMICFPGNEMLLTIFLVMILTLALLKVCGWLEHHGILFWLFFFAMIVSANFIAYDNVDIKGTVWLFDLPLSIIIMITIKCVLLVTALLSGICWLPDLFQKQ